MHAAPLKSQPIVLIGLLAEYEAKWDSK